MLSKMLYFLAIALSAGAVKASVTPTAPGPGDSFTAGSDCTIKWNADETGQWTNVTIYLMSGSNDNMTHVTRVISSLDGTDSSLSPYNWTCPDVDPYSAIYFYQFTNGDDVQDSTWTTRFTITAADGSSEPPAYDTQSDGEAISWGEGRLDDDGDELSAEAATVDRHSTGDDNSSQSGGQNRGTDSDVSSPSPTPLQGNNTPLPSGSAGPSNTASDSLYWTANSLSARPTRTARPSGTDVAAEDVTPTASLPAKKSCASHSTLPSSSVDGSYANGTSCSAMGPGVPQVGSMQLANGVAPRHGGAALANMSLRLIVLTLSLWLWL
ncbi:hypothetical protein FKP32DRAFT_1651520 [Trametes sanguinea]|nr:hypothetical protein FKP32DRAFT_1651520 [Trametes sanguinea]